MNRKNLQRNSPYRVIRANPDDPFQVGDICILSQDTEDNVPLFDFNSNKNLVVVGSGFWFVNLDKLEPFLLSTGHSHDP